MRQHFSREIQENSASRTSGLLPVCTCLDGMDRACSASNALHLGTLYASKSSILPSTKMFISPPDKYKFRRISARMEKKGFLKLGVSM